MALDRTTRVPDDRLEVLTRETLRRRVRGIARDLAGASAAEDRTPQWIEPAELVRRVAPFVSPN